MMAVSDKPEIIHSEISSVHDNDLSVAPMMVTSSADPNDPLNWRWFEKHTTLLLVSMMVFNGGFVAASPAAGLISQAEDFHTSVSSMLNSIGTQTLFLGVGGFLWVPLAHSYGRRPIYLAAVLVGTLGALGCSLANTLGAFIAARVINGLGGSGPMALASLTVSDLFHAGERGQKMGVWTVFFGMSPYISAVVDGVVTVYAGWRWMQWLTFFTSAFLLLLSLILLPETLYRHDEDEANQIPPSKSYLKRMKFKRVKNHPTIHTFYKPFQIALYPSILLPSLYYGNIYGFAVFASLGILPFAFGMQYGFSAVGQGLVAISLLMGTILGEPLAGPLSDWVVRRLAKRHDGLPRPEDRLHTLWLGATLLPIGLIILGTTIQYHCHWIAPCIGMALAALATQIVATVCFTYAIDCYEERAGEVSLLCNFGRQIFSFYVPFYISEFVTAVGYAWVFGIYAIISVVLFLPLVGLMFYGERVRRWIEGLGEN